MNQIDIIFCDLDGTLCDVRHRQHLAQAGAWDEFHEGLVNDAPRPVVLAFLHMMLSTGISPHLVFLTGRTDDNHTKTVNWLMDQCGLAYGDDFHHILMRPKGEYGSDTVIKQKLMEEFLPAFYNGSGLTTDEIKHRVLILDDRDKVVAHFRDLGYECWQVNEGAF